LPLRRHAWMMLLATAASFCLCGCGTHTPPSPAQPLNASSIGCPGNNAPCAASIDVPQILVNGTDPATYGLPIACSVTANNSAMKFSAAPSMPWFGVSPFSGSLQPDGTTTLAVNSVSAINVSSRNIGAVTVSASGYKDNSQMQVELDCNVAAGSCKVAFTCDPKTNPLP
jgi:hypothetical protein